MVGEALDEPEVVEIPLGVCGNRSAGQDPIRAAVDLELSPHLWRWRQPRQDLLERGLLPAWDVGFDVAAGDLEESERFNGDGAILPSPCTTAVSPGAMTALGRPVRHAQQLLGAGSFLKRALM